jgi:radical SAM protein (TIGR01212 family)
MHYYRLKDYLNERFGARVHRVTIEGGFTCPNRDGTKAVGGCTFCTDDGSSSGARNPADTIAAQVEDGIAKQSKRFSAKYFIAYFQSFTNTYAPVDELRVLYDQAVLHPKIKVLAIGSRPDCISEEVIDLLEEYTKRGLEVWIDIGVQSVHNDTLDLINRAHTYEDFVDAAARLKARNNPLLRICTHVILGLPGENEQMMLETAEKLAKSPIDDLKIHQLCIFKGTAMEIDYLNDELKVFARQEYIELLAKFISRIPRHIVIQRLMGEGKVGELIAPEWADHGLKTNFLRDFENYLDKHKLSQGCLVAV